MMAQVSLFAGLVVVDMTIIECKCIVLVLHSFPTRRSSDLDRRAVVAHVVRPEVPPRIPEREELRWILDGVGQPRADADRDRKSTRLRPSHSQRPYAA